MTFVYEADRVIAFDLLDSLMRACKHSVLDFYFTDDASPSHLGKQILDYCEARGSRAFCIRNHANQGFRGAIDRTLRLVRTIAESPLHYDLILRIDSDALVLKPGLDLALADICKDPVGLYGVIRYMRPRDRIGLLCDLLPAGFKRQTRNGRIEKDFSLSRFSPVWWSRFGWKSLLQGFDFGFVEGSCYAMGKDLPRQLLERGFFDHYDRRRFGLITSEEDVIITLLCRAAGLPIYHLDQHDPSWKLVNRLGHAVLDLPLDDIPFVLHPLKSNLPHHAALRAKLKSRLPLFADHHSDINLRAGAA